MKTKRFFSYLLIAVLGGTIALLGYGIFFRKPEVVITPEVKNDTQLTRFANLPPGEIAHFDFSSIAEETVRGVVHVKTVVTEEQAYNPLYEYFFGNHSGRPRSREYMAFGSGVIISTDGYIVTNYHVIKAADKIQVILDDKRAYDAKLVGDDPNTDLALLKIDADDLHPIPIGNSDKVKLGQWVLAVGNPFNLTSTVTAGIISAKGRNLGILGNRNYQIESYLQTDAALNPGNSGGALVNTDGELIGITSAIVSSTGDYSGNSFAIPVEIVKKVVADLREFGRVQRAILGVSIDDVSAELAKDKKLDKIEGVFISKITEGGAAEAADIKEGDIILAVDGKEVNSVAELQETFSRYRPGDKVTVLIKRNKKTKPYEVVLRNLEGGTNIVKTGGSILGARFTPVTNAEKKKYNIDYGMKIVSLKSGKLTDLGFKKGYIIVRLNDNKIASENDLRKITDAGTDIYSVQGVTPDGMEFRYRIR